MTSDTYPERFEDIKQAEEHMETLDSRLDSLKIKNHRDETDAYFESLAKGMHDGNYTEADAHSVCKKLVEGFDNINYEIPYFKGWFDDIADEFRDTSVDAGTPPFNVWVDQRLIECEIVYTNGGGEDSDVKYRWKFEANPTEPVLDVYAVETKGEFKNWSSFMQEIESKATFPSFDDPVDPYNDPTAWKTFIMGLIQRELEADDGRVTVTELDSPRVEAVDRLRQQLSKRKAVTDLQLANDSTGVYIEDENADEVFVKKSLIGAVAEEFDIQPNSVRFGLADVVDEIDYHDGDDADEKLVVELPIDGTEYKFWRLPRDFSNITVRDVEEEDDEDDEDDDAPQMGGENQ